MDASTRSLADRLAQAIAEIELQWEAAFEAGEVQDCRLWEEFKQRLISDSQSAKEARRQRRRTKAYQRAAAYVRGLLPEGSGGGKPDTTIAA